MLIHIPHEYLHQFALLFVVVLQQGMAFLILRKAFQQRILYGAEMHK